MKLGETIRKARQDRRLSQSELARRAGISQNYLSQIESGGRPGSLDILTLIAKALDIPPEELVKAAHEGTDPPLPDMELVYPDKDTQELLDLWESVPSIARPAMLRLLRAARQLHTAAEQGKQTANNGTHTPEG